MDDIMCYHTAINKTTFERFLPLAERVSTVSKPHFRDEGIHQGVL